MRTRTYILSKSLANNIKLHRRNVKVKQQEVAQWLNVSSMLVCKWEKCQTPIPLLKFRQWCVQFKLPWEKTFKKYTGMTVMQAVKLGTKTEGNYAD